MKLKENLFVVSGLLAGTLFAPSAHAYLDPSTGSMIISAVLGVLATIGLAVKHYWYKLKSLFRKTDPQTVQQSDASEAADRAPTTES